MIGHTLSACGAIETVFSLMTLDQQRIPPTINYDIPDPGLLLDIVGNRARDARMDVALTDSFGFGGQNAALVVSIGP
jgi:3-oxoacyl-[acyl-carrier-protein] synthase II